MSTQSLKKFQKKSDISSLSKNSQTENFWPKITWNHPKSTKIQPQNEIAPSSHGVNHMQYGYQNRALLSAHAEMVTLLGIEPTASCERRQQSSNCTHVRWLSPRQRSCIKQINHPRGLKIEIGISLSKIGISSSPLDSIRFSCISASLWNLRRNGEN